MIAKTLKTPENFINLSKENKIDDLLNIDGIGETQISSIKKFFLNKTNLKVIQDLQKILNIKKTIEIKND